ncbi:MAG: ferrous iron transporter B [Planctomycetota bacterium]|nr:MAG: ferrous iron transporter B [Planctomycetota bacterium]
MMPAAASVPAAQPAAAAAAQGARRPLRIALVGNPNVGKTTLFNRLTGLHQRVGNFPGVTVERKLGRARLRQAGGEAAVELVDLPGAYSLVPDALDEEIVARYLCGELAGAEPVAGRAQGRGAAAEPEPPPDAAIVVVDATNLRRNLFLLSEALDCGVPVVVALNMVDEARAAGIEIDARAIERAAGVRCVETVARSGAGLEQLLEEAVAAARQGSSPRRCWRLSAPEERQLGPVLDRAPRRWPVLVALRAADPQLRQREIEARYRWAAMAAGPEAQRAARARRRSDRLDRVLLHPVLGPAIFVLVMGLLFQAVFAWAAPLMDLLEAGFAALAELVRGEGLWSQFLADGVIAGVGAVVVFLPQIVILFLGLGLLEDTGYLTRAAFIVDRPLKALGLSGRAFLPLMSSFACAIPGILAARTIPDRRERMVTIFLAPLMTCSARLPIYALLIAAFVPAKAVLGVLSLQGLVLLGLYLAGMGGAALFALLIERFGRPPERLSGMLELPPYRMPTLRTVLLRLKVRAGAFLRRAGTLIFCAAVALWALASFPRLEPPPGTPPAQAAQLQLAQSAAGRLGRAIEPVLAPLGFDWKVGIGIIGSFAAREVFVSTMAVVYAVGDAQDAGGLRAAMQAQRWPDGSPVYTLPMVLALLVFYAFALQCVSTLAVVARETGSRLLPLVQFIAFGAFAWLAAFATYHGARALGL